MKKMYMYDVRGIQNYIFKTNKVKEIIGASSLVENLIIDLFRECSNEEGKTVVSEFSSKSPLQFRFDETNSIDSEILYYGGGNLLVLYEDEEFAERVSRRMRIELIRKSYSLQIAYASVDVKDANSYKEDYEQLRKNMEQVKVNMPMTMPVQGFPMTLQDPQTGNAFSMVKENNMVTYESYKKLEEYDRLIKDKKVLSQKINEFGSMEGESLIAIVHIDGNNMGNEIRKIMQNVDGYESATEKFRSLSEKIQHTFVDLALKSVENHILDFCRLVQLNNKIEKNSFRKIIGAGDDITFICNARIALYCVRQFMKALENTGFTACAGIFITHSHFPFARAYTYAEELCNSAKKISRSTVGNYVDFHINFGGILNDLESIRKKYYVSLENNNVLARPYHVGKSLSNDNIYELNDLLEMIQMFKEKDLARSKLKRVRETLLEGDSFVEKELDLINSRLEDKFEIHDYPLLFDAIDVMDMMWGELYDFE